MTARRHVAWAVLLALSAGAAPPRTDGDGDLLPEGAVLRLGTARWRHGERVGSVAFTPDGKRLVSGSHDGTVAVWEFPSGKRLTEFRPAQRQITQVLVSPDGKTVYTRTGESVVRSWDLGTGKPGRPVTLPDKNGTFGVALSPDGTRLASAGIDTAVRVWDTATGREVRQFGTPLKPREIEWVQFAADGAVLLAAAADRVRRWKVATGEELEPLRCEPGRELGRIAVSPDGKRAAACCSDTFLRVWDLDSAKVVARCAGHSNTHSALAFSPDGKLIAGAGPLSTARVWDAATGEVRHLLEGHHGEVLGVAFSPDGKTVATGAWDATIRLWDAATGKELTPRAGHENAVRTLAFTPDGKGLVSGGGRTVVVWDVPAGRERLRLDHAYTLRTVAVSPDGRRLASAAFGVETARLWDLESGRLIRKLGDGADASRGPLAFDPEGRWLAAPGLPGQVVLWSPADGARLKRFDDPDPGTPISLAALPGGRVVTGHNSALLRVWDAGAGRLRKEMAADVNSVMVLAASADGRSLAMLDDLPDEVTLSEAATGGRRRLLTGSERSLHSAAFHPGGRLLAAGDYFGAVLVWDVAANKVIARFPGHRGQAVALAFSPDGRLLASGSYDTSVLVWDVSGLRPAARPALADGSFARLWDRLAGSDAADAFQAVCDLTADPARGVPLLRGRLKPVEPADAETVARLLADLESPRFGVREKAYRGLRAFGERAARELEKARESPSAEVRRQAERLLKSSSEDDPSPERLRELRAVEALELAGTKEARGLLAEWAKGAPSATLTRAAGAALKRGPGG